jgi:hypothetical protein
MGMIDATSKDKMLPSLMRCITATITESDAYHLVVAQIFTLVGKNDLDSIKRLLPDARGIYTRYNAARAELDLRIAEEQAVRAEALSVLLKADEDSTDPLDPEMPPSPL